MPVPSVKLNNGAYIPSIGIGSWGGLTAESRANVRNWIGTALKAGYRHIDTALIYGTEKYVGEAIRDFGIPREEVFVTSKLPWNHFGRVQESFNESLENSGLGYFDLYLIHFPVSAAFDEQNPSKLPQNPDGSFKVADTPTFNDAWDELEKIHASGKAKAIGVSNFSVKTLEQLFKTAKVTPAVNQVELHPYLAQKELLEYCSKRGIVVTAYTPTGYATVRGDPLVVELAEKYKVSPAQIILAWHLARGSVVVPKSENVERQKENINLPTLASEDLEKISGLNRNERLCNKADQYGQVYGWTLEQLGW